MNLALEYPKSIFLRSTLWGTYHVLSRAVLRANIVASDMLVMWWLKFEAKQDRHILSKTRQRL